MTGFDRGERALALCLALIAGFVDASGFLISNGIFVAFMSGNSTRLGVAAAEASNAILPILSVIAAFVAGVAVATAIGRSQYHRRSKVLACVSMALVLASAFSFLNVAFAAVCAMAFAMGAINIVLADADGVRVGLTYITGALIKVGQAIGGQRNGAGGQYWSAALWLALVVGCTLGALAFRMIGIHAIAVAAVAVAVLSLATRRAIAA